MIEKERLVFYILSRIIELKKFTDAFATFLFRCVESLYIRRTNAGFSKLQIGVSSGSPLYLT